jgi:hypothetical protein
MSPTRARDSRARARAVVANSFRAFKLQSHQRTAHVRGPSRRSGEGILGPSLHVHVVLLREAARTEMGTQRQTGDSIQLTSSGYQPSRQLGTFFRRHVLIDFLFPLFFASTTVLHHHLAKGVLIRGARVKPESLRLEEP